MYTRLKQLPYKTNALFRFYVLFIGLKTGKFCWTSIRTAEWIVYHYWRTQRNYTVSQLTPWNGIKINIVIWNSLLVLSLILCFTVYKKGYLSPSLPEVLHFFQKKNQNFSADVSRMRDDRLSGDGAQIQQLSFFKISCSFQW